MDDRLLTVFEEYLLAKFRLEKILEKAGDRPLATLIRDRLLNNSEQNESPVQEPNSPAKTKMTREEFLEAYAKGTRNFRDRNLFFVNLRDSNLRGVNLNGAFLDEANLQDVNLDEASLRESDLDKANLQGASLQGASLNNSSLRRAILTGAKLTASQLAGCDLSFSDLSRGDLKGANLKDANLRYACLQDACLRDSDLRFSDLRSTNLEGCDLRGANLDYSAWPLHHNSLGAIIDRHLFLKKLGRTLALRVLDNDNRPDPLAQAVRESLRDLLDEYPERETAQVIRQRMEEAENDA